MPRTAVVPLEDVDGADLPELSPADQAGVEALIAGQTAVSAYLIAHPNSTKRIAWSNAVKWRKRADIRAWIDAALDAQSARHALSKDDYRARFLDLARKAEAAGNFSAAAKCAELAGKLDGMFVERVQTVGNAPRPEELLSALQSVLSAPLVRAVAGELGLPVPPEVEAAARAAEGQITR